MEHPCSMGPINTYFWESARFYTASQTYHPHFLWDIFLTPNLPRETFGTFYIEIMIDKEIAKLLQNWKYFTLMPQKRKKCLNFFSDRPRYFLLRDNTVVHKYNVHNCIPREYGHQLGSNLNCSSVPVFHGSRTSPMLQVSGMHCSMSRNSSA